MSEMLPLLEDREPPQALLCGAIKDLRHGAEVTPYFRDRLTQWLGQLAGAEVQVGYMDPSVQSDREVDNYKFVTGILGAEGADTLVPTLVVSPKPVSDNPYARKDKYAITESKALPLINITMLLFGPRRA